MENTLQRKYDFSGMFWFFALFSLINLCDFAIYSQEIRKLIITLGFGLMAYAHAKYSQQFGQNQKSNGYYLSIIGATLGIIGIFMRFI